MNRTEMLWVKCDLCGWKDSVAFISHLRAWFHAACPVCGAGEIIDASEARVAEELIAMERLGWLWPADAQSGRPGVKAELDTAAPDILTWHR